METGESLGPTVNSGERGRKAPFLYLYTMLKHKTKAAAVAIAIALCVSCKKDTDIAPVVPRTYSVLNYKPAEVSAWRNGTPAAVSCSDSLCTLTALGGEVVGIVTRPVVDTVFVGTDTLFVVPLGVDLVILRDGALVLHVAYDAGDTLPPVDAQWAELGQLNLPFIGWSEQVPQ